MKRLCYQFCHVFVLYNWRKNRRDMDLKIMFMIQLIFVVRSAFVLCRYINAIHTYGNSVFFLCFLSFLQCFILLLILCVCVFLIFYFLKSFSLLYVFRTVACHRDKNDLFIMAIQFNWIEIKFIIRFCVSIIIFNFVYSSFKYKYMLNYYFIHYYYYYFCFFFLNINIRFILVAENRMVLLW